MKCLRCQHENPADAVFCQECGKQLELTCPGCGTANQLSAKFCKKCGQPMATAPPAMSALKVPSRESYTPKNFAEKILTSKSALEGERKQVTVLFADLKGSMELLAYRDPEEARKILDPVLEHMMEAVHRYEGTVNQVMGDGIMALFGAPLAHEDHAVRACYAALRMQERVKHYAEEVNRTDGVPIQIRVGLNSGEVVVRSVGSDLHMDYTAVGQTTHLASRLEQLSMPNSVLISPETLRLVEGYIVVKPLGPRLIKGLDAPLDVYELIAAAPVRSRLQAVGSRGLTRFVGREAEMDQLDLALQQAYAGRGKVVAVVGEPGVGKSRLYWEFTHSHCAQGWRVVEGGSVSYGRATNYLPVIELLQAYFELEASDDSGKVREKVTGRLLSLDRQLESVLPALLWLLDIPVDDPIWARLDPSQRRQQILDGVKRLLLRESQARPLILVFEDLHWIDAETQALLDNLVESLPTARLLLLVNYRPEYQHAWSGKTSYRQLRIEPLPATRADELLDAMLGSDSDLHPLKQLLIARTEGNPFFLEESVRTLVETKALAGARGAYRLVRSLNVIQVPATVQAVLAARIDCLPPVEKTLLQSAAVIGKDIPFILLRAIADLPDWDLRRAITHLMAGELLYETRLFPEPEYTFKHALTHEVAYGSLLHDQRRVLHARILDAVHALAGQRPEEQIERLAHHAFRAELWEKAATYLHRAGVKAFNRSAHREAAGFFEQALVALDRLPSSRERNELILDIRCDLRHALQSLGDLERLRTNLELAEASAEAIDDPRRLGTVLAYLTDCLRRIGDQERAIQVGRRALAITGSLPDLEAHIPINTYLGQVYHGRAEYQLAAELFRQNIEALVGSLVYERFGLLQIPSVHSRTCLAWCLMELGEFNEAIEAGTEGLAIANSVDHPINLAVASSGLGSVYLQHGDVERAIVVLERGLEICQTHNVPLWFPRVASDLGLGYARCGRIAEAVALLEQAVARGSVMGLIAGHSRSMAALAEAYLLAELGKQASELARRAFDLARQQGERGYEAWISFLLAEVARRSDDVESAHESCHHGLALAEDLRMRPLIAHLRLCVGRLALRSNAPRTAEEELAAAAALFGEMGMTRGRTEAEWAQREVRL